MMTPELEQRWNDYFDGLLSPDANYDFLAQIQASPDLSIRFQHQQLMLARLANVVEIDPPAGLADRIAAQIAQEADSTEQVVVPLHRRQSVTPIHIFFRSAAAAILLMGVVGLGTQLYPQVLSPTAETAAPQQVASLPEWEANTSQGEDVATEHALETNWLETQDLTHDAQSMEEHAGWLPDQTEQSDES